jgi:hypothetical protein
LAELASEGLKRHNRGIIVVRRSKKSSLLYTVRLAFTENLSQTRRTENAAKCQKVLHFVFIGFIWFYIS